MAALRFDLVTLRTFVAVAEEGSIAAAAAREHLVASALSKRLAQLERDIGVDLVSRHARGISLTPAGETLLLRARDILRSAESTALELKDYAGDGHSHIRVSANHSSMVHFLPADLASFLAGHPRSKVDLMERLSADVVRAVAEGLADVGIHCWPVVPAGMKSFPYRKDELVLAVPPSHPLAGRADVALEEAADNQFIAYFPNLTLATAMPEVVLRGPSRLRIHMANFEATCRMVEEGLGLAVLPRANVLPLEAQGRIACVRLRDHWAHRQLLLCLRDEHHTRRAVLEFARHLADRAAAAGTATPI